jgi:ribosomal protein S18 acetylase RimI-like enzyme
MDAIAAERLLDDPVWSALTTGHAHLARGDALARRYPADIAPFAAMASTSPVHVAALRTLVDIGELVAVVGATVPDDAAGWVKQDNLRLVQMIRRDPRPLPQADAPIVRLDANDVDAMLALVEITHPGPFRRRTIELGTFVGVRHGGRLVAMAGERMHAGAFREVSGVCTHPDAQGKGLARALMAEVVNRMLRAGEVPFLHADRDNTRAIALYESMGFELRAQFVRVLHRRTE